MMTFQETMSFLSMIPFALVGVWYLWGLIKEFFEYRKGKVKVMQILPNFTVKESFIKPDLEKQTIEIKGGMKKGNLSVPFSDTLGYIIRKGMKPLTIISVKDGKQIDFSSSKNTNTISAAAQSRNIQEAYVLGQLSAKEEDNLIKMLMIGVIVLVGLTLITSFLSFTSVAGVKDLIITKLGAL